MTFDKDAKKRIIQEFGQTTGDTGSSQVQAAVLTHKIVALTEHCKQHPKDVSSKRGLLRMVNQRKNSLRYVERKSRKKYEELIQRLGLRK